MKVVVHDYSGHPCQVHLSRELARRGHRVEHQYCASYTTGRGATERRADDPELFAVRPIRLRKEFARYSPVVRLRQELQYGLAAIRAIHAARPDVAVLSNVPLLSLILITSELRIRRLPYIFWQQDIYSDAIGRIARQRLGRFGHPVGWLARRAERRVARCAAEIVAISETFLNQLEAWGIARDKVDIVPNWAAIDEMPQFPRDNSWAQAHGLVDVPVIMYAGTLGLKHDASLLANLARTAPTGCRLVVVSQGSGREWLESQVRESPGLMLLDYQPYSLLPEMLASADVLLAVLESDASRYSVPSKVLNYLCAGRPVLAVLPSENSVARMLEVSGAGLVVSPGDCDAASAALRRLLSNHELRTDTGVAARRYAERVFDVGAVGDVFESVLRRAVRR